MNESQVAGLKGSTTNVVASVYPDKTFLVRSPLLQQKRMKL
jgi:hypothetical protein